jgi:uncharacterized protein with von Willebrand factor type A (vWA) domain
VHYCRFAHESEGLEADIRELLEDRLYRFFLAGEGADAPSPASHPASPDPGSAAGIDDAGTGRAVADVLDRLCRTAAVERYTRGNPSLAERAAHDAVAWCANRLVQAKPNESLQALDRLAAWRVSSVESETESLDQALLRLSQAKGVLGSSAELDFLTGRLHDLRTSPATAAARPVGAAHSAGASHLVAASHREEAGNSEGVTSAAGEPKASVDLALQRQAVRSAVTAAHREIDWLIAVRRQQFLTAAFVESFPAFVAELNDLLPRLAAVQQRLRDFFGAPGALWDRELREWEEVPWEDLERLARELESEDSLERLARLLGRMSRTGTSPAPTASQTATQVTKESVAVGRSEVDGVKTGTDLGSLTAGELALLADEATRPLFDKRYADGDLVIRSYKTREERKHRSTEASPPRETQLEEEGPIVVCVDTSGSMAGEPERVAKLATLALTRAALATGRRCFLVFFSTQIHCIEVTDVGASIDRLVGYLRGSVRGGTDVAPALRKAIEVLESSSYANADVLVVSDFRIPKVPAAIRSLIGREQTERGTRFHSLTITNKPVHDAFFLFDYRWLYDISNPISRGIPPDAFRLLR